MVRCGLKLLISHRKSPGRIIDINVHDNQFVKSGDPLFSLDPVPFKIAVDNAEAALAKAAADLAKANHEAARRRGLRHQRYFCRVTG